MRYGVQHLNKHGKVYRARHYHTLAVALERAPWIQPLGTRKPNPDQWRVVRFGGTLDNPTVEEIIRESSGYEH